MLFVFYFFVRVYCATEFRTYFSIFTLENLVLDEIKPNRHIKDYSIICYLSAYLKSLSMIVFYINDIKKASAIYTYLCTGNILIESLNPFAKGLLSIFRRVICNL